MQLNQNLSPKLQAALAVGEVLAAGITIAVRVSGLFRSRRREAL